MAESIPVSIELFGASAACHDFHTVEGDFQVRHAELRDAATSKQRCVVTTPVTRANYRVLAEMPLLLQRQRVAQWGIAFPETFSPVTLIARFSMAVPFALHALNRAGKLGIDVFVEGAPACLLGPYRKHARRAPERSFPPPCQQCQLRSECSGVDAEYVEAFGVSELTPVG